MGRKNIPIATSKKGGLASGKKQREKAEKEYYSEERLCFWCHKPLILLPHQKVYFKKTVRFCGSSCAAKHRWHVKRFKEGLPEPKKFGPYVVKTPFKTIGEGPKQMINQHARNVYNSRFKKQYCELCGYENFIDVAHIKPIASFSKDTPFFVVNTLSNLIGLCPNHHREFDNGYIELESIKSLVDARPTRDLNIQWDELSY